MRAAILAATLALGGCSLAPQYTAIKAIAEEGVERGIADRQSFNDTKTEVLLALPCDASLGAVMRIGDSRKRAILIELCGGPPADSQMTVDDLAAMMRVMQGVQP